MEAFVPQEFEAIRIPFELICVAPDYDLTLRHAQPFIKASFWTLSACLLPGQPSAHHHT